MCQSAADAMHIERALVNKIESVWRWCLCCLYTHIEGALVNQSRGDVCAICTGTLKEPWGTSLMVMLVLSMCITCIRTCKAQFPKGRVFCLSHWWYDCLGYSQDMTGCVRLLCFVLGCSSAEPPDFPGHWRRDFVVILKGKGVKRRKDALTHSGDPTPSSSTNLQYVL